jgi:7-cyano-7-deazaguanine synthase
MHASSPNNPLAIAIVSGGMDSITLTYDLVDQGYDVKLLSFDYGQRHRKELNSASFFAHRLGLQHRVVDLSALRDLLSGSALTQDEVVVPDGHYTEDSMRITVVPNRNAIMLAIAWGWCTALKAEFVATAVHAGDHAIYPDCRPEFIRATNEMFRLATLGFSDENAFVFAPYIHMTKSEIVREGTKLRVPYEHTWSCYKGGDKHCGQCGTCTERVEAFKLAGVTDPTTYENEPRYA